MAYTYGGNKLKSSPNNFGGLRVDANRVAMSGALGNFMQSIDATATPVTSPITNGSGAGITLTVPQGAIQIVVHVLSAVTLLAGEDSTFTYGMMVPTGTSVTFDVANQQYFYIKPSSGTNTIYFYFRMV